MRTLITGIAGFAGSHLADHLIAQGHEVSGISFPGETKRNISHLLDRISLYECDIRDTDSIPSILSETRPNWVFHLAALSSIEASWKNPTLAFEVNVIGSLRFIEACLPFKNHLLLLLVTSAEIYGRGNASDVLTENSSYSPQNPYAVTKLALDLSAEQIARSKDFRLIRLQPLNHTGPRQSPGFSVTDFAKQIAEIEMGKRKPVIKVGNLKSSRDFTDVRDIARAYALAAEHGTAGEAYLICTGKCRIIQDVLDVMLSFSKVPITIEQDPAKIRPTDPNTHSALPSKFVKATGWHPEIPFEQTIYDTLEYWRGMV